MVFQRNLVGELISRYERLGLKLIAMKMMVERQKKLRNIILWIRVAAYYRRKNY